MYTVSYTGQSGQVLKLLLTDAEFEAGLHRAQENSGDVSNNTPATRSEQQLRGSVVDPCTADSLLGSPQDQREQLNG